MGASAVASESSSNIHFLYQTSMYMSKGVIDSWCCQTNSSHSLNCITHMTMENEYEVWVQEEMACHIECSSVLLQNKRID